MFFLCVLNPAEVTSNLEIRINPLQPGVAYLYPLSIPPLSFLMFSEGIIDKQHPAVMD